MARKVIMFEYNVGEPKNYSMNGEFTTVMVIKSQNGFAQAKNGVEVLASMVS